jgi:hypothetical protein
MGQYISNKHLFPFKQDMGNQPQLITTNVENVIIVHLIDTAKYRFQLGKVIKHSLAASRKRASPVNASRDWPVASKTLSGTSMVMVDIFRSYPCCRTQRRGGLAVGAAPGC